ncbi:ThuA-like domain-containing protein [Lentinula aff. lateritia]|uniref:ThuA-like domain-containing protein n=1 Tax=Lentinula aff. lateritia TaxID=2804960 RepID=A0ACC1TT34_9AGAR|nr:ThuA-like domain-containing protein [Lentinula aff. lateritia]
MICRLVASCSAFTAGIIFLIYSATEDFRHDSIPTAIQSLQSKGPSFDIQFETTEDRAQFTDQYLAQYDTLLFFDHTGEGDLIGCRCSSTVLDDLGKAVLQKNLDLGGNFIGIHAASDCLKDTTFYGHETVDVIDSSHPSTAQWHAQDEMCFKYNFKSDPRTIGATIILSANESRTRLDQGTPHPTAWFQDRGAGAESNGTAGRSFYTSLGHLNET